MKFHFILNFQLNNSELGTAQSQLVVQILHKHIKGVGRCQTQNGAQGHRHIIASGQALLEKRQLGEGPEKDYVTLDICSKLVYHTYRVNQVP